MCKEDVKYTLKERHLTEESIVIVMLLNYRMVDVLLAYFVGNSDFVTDKLCEE